MNKAEIRIKGHNIKFEKKNINALKELIKMYRKKVTIAALRKEIKGYKKIDPGLSEYQKVLKAFRELTGFGDSRTCIVCQSVASSKIDNNNLVDCFWNKIDKFSSKQSCAGKCIHYSTFKDLARAGTVEDVRGAAQKRADKIEEKLREYGVWE